MYSTFVFGECYARCRTLVWEAFLLLLHHFKYINLSSGLHVWWEGYTCSFYSFVCNVPFFFVCIRDFLLSFVFSNLNMMNLCVYFVCVFWISLNSLWFWALNGKNFANISLKYFLSHLSHHVLRFQLHIS